jgi:hypothetical protein
MKRMIVSLVVIILAGVASGRLKGVGDQPPIAVDCTFAGYGSQGTRAVFSGSGSSVAGVYDVDWRHRAAGFDMQSDGAPDSAICLFNSHLLVVVEGPATVNGESGYSFYFEAFDNRAPPTGTSIIVGASRSPDGGDDGTLVFDESTTVVVPGSIAITGGVAGDGWVWIKFDRSICYYRSGDDAYEFDRCVTSKGRRLQPGDSLNVTDVRMHVAGSSGSADALTVEADVGTGITPAPGTADLYTMVILDAASNVIYASTSNVDGDIRIDRLTDD